MKQVRRSSVVPIYGVGLTWLFCVASMGLYQPGDFVACILLSVGVYLVLRKLFPGEMVEQTQKPANTGDAELDELIDQGRKQLGQIRQLRAQITNVKVVRQLEQIEVLANKILKQVEKDAAARKQVRQFLNYYLPTTVKLLTQYVELLNQGIHGENIQKGMEQIEGLLDTVAVAFQKQLDGLFASQVIDITADIQVMENMMASQGLTKEKDF